VVLTVLRHPISSLYPAIVPLGSVFAAPTDQEQPPGKRKREDHLSRDDKWRSFPKVPRLPQYVSSRNYFGKVKITRKQSWQSLGRMVWSAALLRLNDFRREHQENRDPAVLPEFDGAAGIFRRELKNEATISSQSKK
jgi:hypothetical protein